MEKQISHTYNGMYHHLEYGFGYHREILQQMTVNEIIEAFEKEMKDLFNDIGVKNETKTVCKIQEKSAKES